MGGSWNLNPVLEASVISIHGSRVSWRLEMSGCAQIEGCFSTSLLSQVLHSHFGDPGCPKTPFPDCWVCSQKDGYLFCRGLATQSCPHEAAFRESYQEAGNLVHTGCLLNQLSIAFRNLPAFLQFPERSGSCILSRVYSWHLQQLRSHLKSFFCHTGSRCLTIALFFFPPLLSPQLIALFSSVALFLSPFLSFPFYFPVSEVHCCNPCCILKLQSQSSLNSELPEGASL